MQTNQRLIFPFGSQTMLTNSEITQMKDTKEKNKASWGSTQHRLPAIHCYRDNHVLGQLWNGVIEYHSKLHAHSWGLGFPCQERFPLSWYWLCCNLICAVWTGYLGYRNCLIKTCWLVTDIKRMKEDTHAPNITQMSDMSEIYLDLYHSSLCCSFSVNKSYLTLCDPMDCSTPGFPVLHYIPEFVQIHVDWVADAI